MMQIFFLELFCLFNLKSVKESENDNGNENNNENENSTRTRKMVKYCGTEEWEEEKP